MNRFTKKIKAFTLSEMLVVLLLTVIVVGLAFAILNLVQKQMNSARINYEKGTELNQLRQALWRDFRTYPSIHFSETTQQLQFSNEVDEAYYNFQKTMVIRNIDTFKVSFAKRKFYFEGEIVKGGTINAIELNTSTENDNQKLVVYQEISPETYMNK